ncbi:hypothetical protein [Actinosynnema sp. NPDC020468]|uniref:DUF6973 domain-containing protein n=1 Tax=Actinosynnema sp. NPDC020468 TaxID=3154488 RepID=UPI0033F82265
MPGYGEVREWTPEPLERVVRLLNQLEADLVSLDDDVVAGRPFGSWRSVAAERASEAHDELTARVEDVVATVAAVRRLTGDIADRVDALRSEVAGVEAEAHELGFLLDGNGLPVPLANRAPVNVVVALISALRLRALVAGVLRSARDIDADYAFVLREVADGSIHVSDRANSLADAALAGAVRGSVLHERLLDRFHVAPDTRPMTALGGLLRSMVAADDGAKLNRGETDLVLGLGVGIFRFKDLSEHAITEAADRYPDEPRVDDRGDAFRHTYWNALMSSAFGDRFATAYGTAHEQNAGDPVAQAMDLHNNEVGRQIARENPGVDEGTLAEAVRQAVEGGRTVEIDAAGELVPTGSAVDPPAAPRVEPPSEVRPAPYEVELFRHPLGF